MPKESVATATDAHSVVAVIIGVDFPGSLRAHSRVVGKALGA